MKRFSVPIAQPYIDGVRFNERLQLDTVSDVHHVLHINDVELGDVDNGISVRESAHAN